MRIKYLPRAGENLRDIRKHYLKVGGKLLALKMVKGIRTEVAALTDNPFIAPVYEIVPGVRRMVVASGTFLVFYGVTDRIEVLHIRRAEREPVTAEELGRIVDKSTRGAT